MFVNRRVGFFGGFVMAADGFADEEAGRRVRETLRRQLTAPKKKSTESAPD